VDPPSLPSESSMTDGEGVARCALSFFIAETVPLRLLSQRFRSAVKGGLFFLLCFSKQMSNGEAPSISVSVISTLPKLPATLYYPRLRIGGYSCTPNDAIPHISIAYSH